jgi:hypothetical protein
MRHQASERDGRGSLLGHAAERAGEARSVYGGRTPGLDIGRLGELLEDRRFIRHPVRYDFDGSALEPGEFAFAEPRDNGNPAAGFVIHVHPQFAARPEAVPLLVAYQLVRVNYGEIAGPEAAEVFALCGMTVDDYYAALCRHADSLPAGD